MDGVYVCVCVCGVGGWLRGEGRGAAAGRMLSRVLPTEPRLTEQREGKPGQALQLGPEARPPPPPALGHTQGEDVARQALAPRVAPQAHGAQPLTRGQPLVGAVGAVDLEFLGAVHAWQRLEAVQRHLAGACAGGRGRGMGWEPAGALGAKAR